jgi:hypothetical protein
MTLSEFTPFTTPNAWGCSLWAKPLKHSVCVRAHIHCFNSIGQSPSREVNGHSANQKKNLHILWNTKFHYCAHYTLHEPDESSRRHCTIILQVPDILYSLLLQAVPWSSKCPIPFKFYVLILNTFLYCVHSLGACILYSSHISLFLTWSA